MAPSTCSESVVLKLTQRAYRQGDASFARQAFERGFTVAFGSEVTATDDPDMQGAELMVLRKGFARVLSAAEIVRQLQGGWTALRRDDRPRTRPSLSSPNASVVRSVNMPKGA